MDITEFYEVHGTGSPILFIHGSFASISTWKKIIESLKQKHKCILFKLPGHSGMPDPDDFAEPTIDTELQLLNQIISRECPDGFDLVGHSYGGVVALVLALEKQRQVKKLVLLEPVCTWVLDLARNEVALKQLHTFLQTYRVDAAKGLKAGGRVIDFWCNEAVFARFPVPLQEQLLLLQANNIRHWSICTQSKYTCEDLGHLNIPVSLVAGTKSSPVAHAIIHALEQLLPSAKAVFIQDANHLLVTTHKDACLAAMW